MISIFRHKWGSHAQQGKTFCKKISSAMLAFTVNHMRCYFFSVAAVQLAKPLL
jgi:hypothetical protein